MKDDEWRAKPVAERLAHALVKGLTDDIDQDVEGLGNNPLVLDVIEGPLMAGMNIVGDLFSPARCFFRRW